MFRARTLALLLSAWLGACNDTATCDAPERCNGVDDNCDGLIDEGPVGTVTEGLDLVVTDADGDGWGADGDAWWVCGSVVGRTPQGGDCDDNDDARHPDATEFCNGVDDNCDERVDNLDGSVADGVLVWPDDDEDGWGDRDATPRWTCEPTASTATRGGDCDDKEPAANPAGVERCGGGDEDCDELFDAADPDVADELVTWFFDEDADGWGDDATAELDCPEAIGRTRWATRGGDCTPKDRSTHPGATESCDSGDNDCDGLVDNDDPSLNAWVWHRDLDGDGFAGTLGDFVACNQPPDAFWIAEDCDDADPGRHPRVIDLDCDGVSAGCVPEVHVPADAATLADAFLSARPNATICVGPGTWPAPTGTQSLRGRHLVGVAGADATRVLIGSAWFTCGDDLTVVRGLTFEGGPAGWTRTFRADGEGLVLEDVAFEDLNCDTNSCSGMAIDSGYRVGRIELRNVEFRDTTCSGSICQSSVFDLEADEVKLEGVTVSGVTATAEKCGSVAGSASATASLVVRDLVIEDVSAPCRAGGSTSVGDSGVLSLHTGGDLDVDGVTVTRAVFEESSDWIAGGLLAVSVEPTEGTRTLRHVALRDSRIWVDGWRVEGGALSVRAAGAWGPLPEVTIEHLLVAGVDVTIQGGLVRGGLLSFGVPVRLNHATLVGSRFGFEGSASGTEGLVVRSDVSLRARGVIVADQQLLAPSSGTLWSWTGDADLAYIDTWDADLPAYPAAATLGPDADLALDPRFVDHDPLTDPSGWNLRLAPTSPLLDAGDPSLDDPDGSRAQLGAYGGPDGAW